MKKLTSAKGCKGYLLAEIPNLSGVSANHRTAAPLQLLELAAKSDRL
ncbi:hypothetical protein [Calothrix sp. NIES-2100]